MMAHIHHIQSRSIAVLAILCLFLFMPKAQAIPPIEEAQLSNGLRILLMEAHHVPMVSMQLIVPAGSSHDPKGRGGTASLLADMLTDHTAKHDTIAWSALLDRDALQLGAGASRDGLSLSLTTLRETLPQGVQAMAEALLQPGWNKKRFSILKEDAISSAKKAREKPGIRAAASITKLIFGDHPYGHRSGGSLKSLQKLRLNDLKQLYRAQVLPETSVLAVSGDVRMTDLLKLLNPLLAHWHGTPVHPASDTALPQPTSLVKKQIDMKTRQAHLIFGRLGLARNAPDFFPVFVLNHILGGGGFSSRLMEEVREKRGLAYGAYSWFAPLAVPGPFIISLQTRADQSATAAHVVRQVLQHLHQGKIKPAWLTAAKANMVGGFAQRLDSNRERVSLISMIGFYHLPLDYLQVWTGRVKAVTLDDVKVAAHHYLAPDAWSFVRVGPAGK